MMLDLGEYQEESVNIIAIMGPHGVYHKDEPIKELEAALENLKSAPQDSRPSGRKTAPTCCSLSSTTRASAG